jgi:hypothetical protein
MGKRFLTLDCWDPSKRLECCPEDERGSRNLERGAGGGATILAYSLRVPSDAPEPGIIEFVSSFCRSFG